MDEIKDKFKGLFNKAANAAARASQGPFKGQGNRLGSAEDRGDVSRRTAATAAATAARRSAPGTNNTPISSSTAAQHRSPSAPGVPAQAVASSSQAAAATASQSSSRNQSIGQASDRQDALSPATEFNPFQAVIGTGAALNSIQESPPPIGTTASSSSGRSSSRRPPPPASSATWAAAASSRSSPGPPADPAAFYDTSSLSSQQLDDIETCVYNILAQGLTGGEEGAGVGGSGGAGHGGDSGSSSKRAQQCMATVKKLLNNLLAAPKEPKYRHLRLSNPKLQALVVQQPGGLDLMRAAGFQVHGEKRSSQGASSSSSSSQGASSSSTSRGSAAEDEAGFAVFLEDELLPQAAAAVQMIEQALFQLAAATATTSGGGAGDEPEALSASSPPPAAAAVVEATEAAAAAAAVSSKGDNETGAAVEDRCTEVLLPVAPDTEVPEWFFERTPADVRVEYMSIRKQREEGQQLRIRLKQEGKEDVKESGRVAVVRVRFPEGVCLQGKFGAGEPLSQVHQWVSNALQNPATTAFDLVLPNRKLLPLTGRVRDAGLLPSVLMNFRVKSPGGREAARKVQRERHVPYLSDEMLQLAHCDC